jgi:hypothetical protein
MKTVGIHVNAIEGCMTDWGIGAQTRFHSLERLGKLRRVKDAEKVELTLDSRILHLLILPCLQNVICDEAT